MGKPDRPPDCSLRRVYPYPARLFRLAFLALVTLHALAQPANIAVLPPPPRALGFLTRPYRQRIVPRSISPIRAGLASLIRAGNLYLTAQDVIALALGEQYRYREPNGTARCCFARTFAARRWAAICGIPAPPSPAGPQSVSLAGINVGNSSLSSGTGVGSSGGITVSFGSAIPIWIPLFR